MLLDIKNLTKTYSSGDEELTVLKNLNFSMKEGEIVGVMGNSGSGKSTLLNLIAGIDTLSSGSVDVLGENIFKFKEKKINEYRNKTIGLIFQLHYLINDFTVLENVYFPAIIAGDKKKLAIQKAKELLSQIGLENKMQNYPSILSGGEKQRVAFLRAIINKPKLLLADEPTGSLDSRNRDILIKLIFDMCKMQNSGLIIVTHDKEIFLQTDAKYILKDEKIFPYESSS